MCSPTIRSATLDIVALLAGLALATPFLLILASPFLVRM